MLMSNMNIDVIHVSLCVDPVLNLSFLIDYVMEEVKPLEWEAVLASPIPLKVRTPTVPSTQGCM